jgi:hypothetical protein
MSTLLKVPWFSSKAIPIESKTLEAKLMESKTLEAKLMESYTLKAQESTIDVPEVKLMESLPITIESSTPRTLESIIDILKALPANVIEAPPIESTSTLLKL